MIWKILNNATNPDIYFKLQSIFVILPQEKKSMLTGELKKAVDEIFTWLT